MSLFDKTIANFKAHPKRYLGIPVAVALIGFTLSSVGATGAYFSDSHDGNISGSVGTILVTPDSDTNLAFTNLVPGEPQSVTLQYHNSGTHKEDVWLKFPNATALSALNSLGTYGEAHVARNGTEIFASQNLNDNHTSCPPGSTSVAHPIPCAELPGQILLASDVASGASGSFTFTFGYAAKLTGNGPGVWNHYPAAGGQTTVNASDGSGDGLPYMLVATQPGQQP